MLSLLGEYSLWYLFFCIGEEEGLRWKMSWIMGNNIMIKVGGDGKVKLRLWIYDG